MTKGDTFLVPVELREGDCPAYLTRVIPEDGDRILDVYLLASPFNPDSGIKKWQRNYDPVGIETSFTGQNYTERMNHRWFWAVEASDDEIAGCEILGESLQETAS